MKGSFNASCEGSIPSLRYTSYLGLIPGSLEYSVASLLVLSIISYVSSSVLPDKFILMLSAVLCVKSAMLAIVSVKNSLNSTNALTIRCDTVFLAPPRASEITLAFLPRIDLNNTKPATAKTAVLRIIQRPPDCLGVPLVPPIQKAARGI